MTFTSSFTRNVDVTDVTVFFEESHSEYQRRDSGNIWPVFFLNKIPFEQRQDVLWLWLVSLVTWICFKQVSSCKLQWQWEKISYRCRSRGILQLLQVSRSLKSTGSCENLEGGENRGVAQRYTCRVNKSTKGEVHQFCCDEKNWLKYMFHFFPRSTWRPSLKFSGNFCIDRIDFFIRHVDSILAARGRWQRNQKLPQVPINAFRFQGFQQDLFLGGKGNGGLKKRKVDRLLFDLWKGNCWENCRQFARGKDRSNQFKPCVFNVSQFDVTHL